MTQRVLFRVCKGGWLECDVREGHQLSAFLYARFEQIGDRLEVAELLVQAGGPPVTGDLLRSLPIGRIDAFANGPDLRDLLVSSISDGNDATTHGTADLLGAIVPKAGEQIRPAKAQLSIPGAQAMGRRPDSFYAAVARAYSAVVEGSAASAIADANGVPVTTVHRWVKEARARGLLAPGRRGTRSRP